VVVVVVAVLLTVTGRNGGASDSSSKRGGMAMRSYYAGRRFFFFYVFFLLLCFYFSSFSLSLLFSYMLLCSLFLSSLFLFPFSSSPSFHLYSPMFPFGSFSFSICSLISLVFFSRLLYFIFSFSSPFLISSSPLVFIGGKGRGPPD
jgi:hypothetical protein